MLNNKAQSLVIFVICLPLVLLFFTYVVDVTRVNYEKSKMENILDVSKEEEKENICNLVIKNDKDIECVLDNDTVKLSKRIKSLFGVIIGKRYYDIKASIKI